MRAHLAEDVAKDASARAMTAGLAFPIVFFSACGVTSVHGHQRIMDVMSRQWEPTTHQLSVPAPHPKLLPAPKSLTNALEVTNQL